MPRTSMAFTVPAESSLFFGSGIHRLPTRIIRTQAECVPARTTVVSRITNPGIGCHACRTELEVESQFCGMCGSRVRARTSRIGAVIDGLYEVQATIAEGANATIYRARYLPTGAELALKVLHPELAFDSRLTARFRRESRCLARLRDPRSVTVFDHGMAADGTLYTAMELLRGEGLDVRIRTRGAMQWRAALTILRNICGALAEVHAHGIVHRDLSLSNVILVAGDAVKVIDFGLAKLRSEDDDDDLVTAGEAIGTLRRAAPEQLAGRRCDARADIYALGVIGCELLLGRLPLGDPSTVALPHTTPGDVSALLRRCLATAPEHRFGSALQLAIAIDQLLAPLDAEAVPSLVPRRRRVFAHTPAFELHAPRIVMQEPPVPAFLARGSQPEIAPEPPRAVRWKLWAAALVASGIGLGTAVAGCV